jgi:hypothetical protein
VVVRLLSVGAGMWSCVLCGQVGRAGFSAMGTMMALGITSVIRQVSCLGKSS